MTKYGAQRTSHAGLSFASKLESALYDILFLRVMAGEINDIMVQTTVYLTDADIVYKPDFKFLNCADGTTHYAEAKGFITDAWRIKKKLWAFYGPAPLEIWTGHHSRPTLSETIIPRGKK